MTDREPDESDGLPFDLAPYVERLGPTVVADALRLVDEAPPLSEEQRAALRALFQSTRRTARQSPAA